MFSKHIKLFLLYLLFLCPFSALAQADLYGNCIKGYDMGSLTGENLTISPVNKACQSACKVECKSFSRKTVGGLELNEESIASCTESCQAGRKFTGYFYEEYSTEAEPNIKKIRVSGPAETQVSCSTSVLQGGSISSSEFDVLSGDKINLRVLNNADFNKIYMCGKKTFQVKPLITSLNPKEWADQSKQTVIKDRADNMCAILMDNKAWSSLTNYKMWNPPSYQKCSWNARNPYYTDTGIWVKDGDELMISWNGTYFSKAFETIKNRKDLYDAKKNPGAYKVSAADVANLIRNGGALHIMPPGQNLNSTGSFPIFGETARQSEVGVPPSNNQSGNPSTKDPVFWYGLRGSVVDTGFKINTNMSAPNCDSLDKRAQNWEKCMTVEDPGVAIYTFSGTLKGFAQSPSQLAVRHFDNAVTIPGYANHLGGFDLTISWGGCPIVNGQRLQYSFGSTPPTSESAWRDVSREMISEGKAIIADQDGHIFLRVKPIDVPPSTPDAIKQYYTDPAHRYGQYYLSLTKIGDSGFKQASGPIREVVNTVREVIYGTDKKRGVLQNLYESLVKDSDVILSIRAVLVFYIAFSALGYLIGTVQANQKELLARVFKFAIICTVISPTSWEFFSNNLYKAFMDGGLELIALIGSASLEVNITGAPIVDISKDPAQIFAIFDGPFKMIFSKPIWCKIYALILSGVLGIVLAALFIIAAVYYFLSIVKTVVMFLMSMIIIALLIFAAPLFLCFMLFNFTRQFFDSWWKYLLSFTLQPVVLFTAISIFNILIVLTIMYTMSFTVCPTCLFKIYIPGVVDFCLIPAYNILAVSHYPDNAPFLVPPGALEGCIILLLLAQGMYAFCEKSVEIANLIIAGAMINTTSLVDYGGKAVDIGASAIGMDSQGIARRRQQLQEYNQEQMAKMQQNANTKPRDENNRNNPPANNANPPADNNGNNTNPPPANN